MTVTLSPRLAAIIAGAQLQAPKRKKGETPRLYLECVKEACRMFPDLALAVKDAEQRKADAQALIVAAADPKRVELSRQFNEPLSSVYVNDVLYVHSKPHYTTVLKDAQRVAEVQATFGAEFTNYFTPTFRIADGVTPEQMAGSGLPYVCEWKPTDALHNARTMNPTVEAVCASSLPDVRPIQYCRVGKS